EELLAGSYELHEVKAPEGYVLGKEPIPFEVNSSHIDLDYVTVAFGNVPQLGNATIFKTGDMVTSANVSESEFGDMYNLEFEQKGLEGVTFSVVATEDIVTNDGTVRAEKGEDFPLLFSGNI